MTAWSNTPCTISNTSTSFDESGLAKSERNQAVVGQQVNVVMVRLVGLVIVFVANLGVVASASGKEASKTGIFTFVLENDLFYNTDSNYTNGVSLIWVPPNERTPRWALRIAHLLPWFPADSEMGHGYAVGQNMFTPKDITATDPPLDDRPYAGWLYGTVALTAETGRQLDQLALTIGVVGPASYAEETQKFIHEITGSPEPNGWDTQLNNELGVFVSYQRSWREFATTTLANLELDVSPNFGGALGNVYTYLNTGFTLRYGKRLPLDYGPPRIQPSIQGSAFFVPAESFAWYVFAGIEGRLVGRNIFLDGNTFSDSRSVDKEPLVGDLQWGLVLTRGGARLTYTHVVRTSEFKGQDGSHQFGAFSVSISF